eukprot:1576750-Rhodomonas_salina.2
MKSSDALSSICSRQPEKTHHENVACHHRNCAKYSERSRLFSSSSAQHTSGSSSVCSTAIVPGAGPLFGDCAGRNERQYCPREGEALSAYVGAHSRPGAAPTSSCPKPALPQRALPPASARKMPSLDASLLRNKRTLHFGSTILMSSTEEEGGEEESRGGQEDRRTSGQPHHQEDGGTTGRHGRGGGATAPTAMPHLSSNQECQYRLHQRRFGTTKVISAYANTLLAT